MEHTNQPVDSTQGSGPAPARPLSLTATLAICSGGWLFPGLSHILIGRWIRGLIFFACVLLLFGVGLKVHGKLYDLSIEDPLQILGFVANVGVGVPYLVAERYNMGIGSLTARGYDYGTIYLWVCGLLNYLIVLDAFDIAQGRKP